MLRNILSASATAFLISGCLTLPHKITTAQINGRTIEIHTDAPASIEPDCGPVWAGCYMNGKVWLRSPGYPGILDHELAHAAGMVHGPWRRHPTAGMQCAVVIVAGGIYKVGEAICIDRSGERVFNAALIGE